MTWGNLKKNRVSLNNQLYFITFNTFKRNTAFSQFKTARLFCQQIQINETNTQCHWLTWVLMPDHFHGLVQIKQTSLDKVINDLKGRSAFLINQQLNKKGKFWQPQFYDHAIRKEENIKNIARYIVANPLRKKLVSNVKDYPYWNSDFL